MDAVSEVKTRINIEDVLGEYVRLKRAGKNYKGLSPFTSEKTPSFVVSPEKQIWHDFSSGKGGDVFTFIQEVEGLDFRGALELLARKAGVDLAQFEQKSGKRAGPNKEKLLKILEDATKFYQVQLGANKTALEYVSKKREFTKQTILDFRIGYSPDTGDALTKYLLKKNYTSGEIKSVGLSASRRGGNSDMFVGRVMIPLQDQFGKVIGFTARLLKDKENAPKYINTPSTMLYDKSRHIYGLHLAKKAIQTQKFSVLVEGNLDVISSHQAGVANVVATAGTALTEMQLKVLGRFSPDVRLAFDEDKAGIAATERAIPIAGKTGVELSVITLPPGTDPDDLIKQDSKSWKEIITKNQYALDWLIDIYKKQSDISTASGKRKFSGAVLPIVKALNDPIEVDHYVKKIAEELDVDSGSIRKSLDQKPGTAKKYLKPIKKDTPKKPEEDLEIVKLEDRLLALTLFHARLRKFLIGLREEVFSRNDSKKLFIFLNEFPEFSGSEEESKRLNEIKDYVKIVSLQFEELYAGVELLELEYEATRLRARLVELFVKNQKKQIVNQMEQASDEEVADLLEKVRELDQMLNQTKE